jgi:hypothetical protein
MGRSTRWLVRGAFVAVFIVVATVVIVLPAATPEGGASAPGSGERVISMTGGPHAGGGTSGRA